jgi:hypothetical protein
MFHTGFLIAMVILPVLWLVPLAVLGPLVYFEAGRAGPRLLVHVPLNIAFLAWSAYAVQVLHEGLHSTNSPLIAVPRLLVVAGFYALAVPQMVADARRQRVFRYAFAAIYVIVFGVLFATADWVRAFGGD